MSEKVRAASVSAKDFGKIVSAALGAGKTRKETIAELGMNENSFNTRMTGFRKYYEGRRELNPALPELPKFKGAVGGSRIDDDELDAIIAANLAAAYGETPEVPVVPPTTESVSLEVQSSNIGVE